jgi:hypothetical protein
MRISANIFQWEYQEISAGKGGRTVSAVLLALCDIKGKFKTF